MAEALERAYERWRESGPAPPREVPWLPSHARAALALQAGALLDSLRAS
jgi:hypothetical protein